MIDYAKASDFEDLLNDVFVFSLDGVEEKLEGELISVKRITSDTGPDVQREPFRLRFKLPAGSNVGQCVFRTEHPAMDATQLLLVPAGQDESGWYMDSTFA